MAFLLLLHEKMRLKRQVNKLQLKQVRFGNRLDRMTKNIEKVQKMYSNRQSMIQKQAQMLKSQASVFFRNSMGLGAQGQMFNPYNFAAEGGGLTTFVANQMASMLSKGTTIKGADGKETKVDMNTSTYQSMMTEYMSGTLKPKYPYKEGSTSEYDTTKTPTSYGKGDFKPEQYEMFMSALRQAQMNQSQAQAYCQQMDNQYQSNVSIWEEAQLKQLEAEQDAVLAPLEMEQTDMELEKDSIETQLTYAKERLQALEQACSEEIKNAAPKFGLG